MNINQCEAIARRQVQDGAIAEDIRFQLMGPVGAIDCHWMDPHMGMFRQVGGTGFMMVSDFEMNDKLHCEMLEQPRPVAD